MQGLYNGFAGLCSEDWISRKFVDVESLVLFGEDTANYDRKMRCDIHVMDASIQLVT